MHAFWPIYSVTHRCVIPWYLVEEHKSLAIGCSMHVPSLVNHDLHGYYIATEDCKFRASNHTDSSVLTDFRGEVLKDYTEVWLQNGA